jgi:preprotein translocase subunit YajC
VEALPNVLLLVLAAGLLILMFSRANAARRNARTTQDSLRAGMQVMTGSGLFARIVEVEPEVVVLETAPGQRSRWLKQAIARVIPDEKVQIVVTDEPAPVEETDGRPDAPEAPAP